MPAFSTVIWVACGVAVGWALWKTGIGFIRTMGSSPPPPPPAGEMRKLNVKYRCNVCGLEIKLTLAPDEDPPPPRHCLDDMVVVAPIME